MFIGYCENKNGNYMRLQKQKGIVLVFCFIFQLFFCKLSFLDKCLATAQSLKIQKTHKSKEKAAEAMLQ